MSILEASGVLGVRPKNMSIDAFLRYVAVMLLF